MFLINKKIYSILKIQNIVKIQILKLMSEKLSKYKDSKLFKEFVDYVFSVVKCESKDQHKKDILNLYNEFKTN